MITAEIICIAILNLSIPNANYACEQMEHVVNAAEDLSFEPALLVSLIHYESRWNPDVVSSGGACGLTQVIPRWTTPRKTCRQLLFAPTSIYEGAKMLRRWTDSFGRGSVNRGLCGYNAGYTCRRSTSRGWRYSRKIQRMFRRIQHEIENIQEFQEPGC
tara:strand:+ start:383 stop:859 length:477 start_codon:yes stop_codon:yes gene_type:complete